MALDARWDCIAAHAMERLEEMIAIMEKAAAQVVNGQRLEEIGVGSYRLYIATGSKDCDNSIVCVWSYDEYFDLLSSAAADEGICLEDMARLDVRLPETEFENDLVTGGFAAWKGASVDVRNELQDALIEAVCERMKARGLKVRCSSEEIVIFSMPLGARLDLTPTGER